MRGVSFKPKGEDNFSSGDIKTYGGIYAATAADFAAELGCDPQEFIKKVHESNIEPLTAVGDEEEPEKYSLSFERDKFEEIRALF